MLEVHPQAMAELEASLAWYLARSTHAASAFLASIKQAFADIERTPERWPCDATGFRSVRLHKFPFQIVYRETPRGMAVIAVAHTARRPDYWRGRQ